MNSINESNKIQFDNKLSYIKSIYILNRIFNNLSKISKFKIIKNNKLLQNKLNINIKDYQEYSQKLSLIELEILPIDDIYSQTQIINTDMKYCHIYLNNNKEETKNNYITKENKIKKIKIILEPQIKSFDCLFRNCGYIETITFKTFHRNNIDNMSAMFIRCYNLKKLIIQNFNSSNVTDMSSMFQDCHNLINLDLSEYY